jgi:hypothetical protein
MPRLISKNASSADNQQERPEMIGWIVGFTDGEGCFSVSIVRNKTSSLGWQVMPEFVITQGESSLNALRSIQSFFRCGHIYINKRYDNHTENLYRYCVRSISDLNETIVPFFRTHPLKTKKLEQFQKFEEIMSLIVKRKHLQIEGIKEISNIATQMNVRKRRSFLESSETTRGTPH